MKEIVLFSMSSYENKNIANWILENLEDNFTFIKDPFDEINWKFGKKRIAKQDDSLIIYNIEDKEINTGINELKEKSLDYSENKGNKNLVLVLQDPYNLFADRFDFQNSIQNKSTKNWMSRSFFNCWKNHAKEVNQPSVINLIINYNQWTISQKYRNFIAQKLDLSNKNDNFHNVKSLKKYKKYKYDKKFMSLFDRDTNKLAEDIFRWKIK